MIYFIKFIKFQDKWFKVHKKRKFKPELKISHDMPNLIIHVSI